MKKIKLLFGLPILLIGNSVCFAQNWLWAKEGDRQSDPQSNCVAMSNDGGAYLAGTFSDSISFGSWHLKSPYFNSYIVKYDIVGNVVWAEQSNGHSGTECNEICADKMGNAYITGFFSDTIQFGTYTLGNNANNTDELFLVKYDNTGTVAWARESTNLSSGTVAYGNAVATDKSDNVYLTGRFFWGAMQLGAITLNELSSWWNVFLAKYDSAGNVLWAKEANYPSSNCYANGVSVATDDSGNVYLTGQFHDTIIFGTYILKSISGNGAGGDAFLVKYDKNGNVLWAKQSYSYSRHSNCFQNAIITDKEDNIYVTGSITDTVSFGTYMLKSNSMGAMFLVKYNANGNIIWAKQSVSDTGYWSGYSLAYDNKNQLYFSCGEYYPSFTNNKVTFCNDSFSFVNAPDPSIVARLDTSGNILCSTTLSTGGDDNNGIACDVSGGLVYFGGDVVYSAKVILGRDTLKQLGNAEENPFIARWQPCGSTEGISELNNKSDYVISLFPNPSNGVFNLVIASPPGRTWQSPSTIEVYNELGQQVYSQAIVHTSSFIVNLSTQPNGVYLYRVITNDGNLVGAGKLVIDK